MSGHMLPPLGATGNITSAPNANQSGSPLMNNGNGNGNGQSQAQNQGQDQSQFTQESGTANSGRSNVTPQPGEKPFDAMRAYRACLHCRNRKSKCDLDPNGGKPVCFF